APPAKALPNPLPLCSCNAKAEPKACPPASASAAPASAAATRVRRNGCDLICSLLLKWNDALLLRFFGPPESPEAWRPTIHRRDVQRIVTAPALVHRAGARAAACPPRSQHKSAMLRSP